MKFTLIKSTKEEISDDFRVLGKPKNDLHNCQLSELLKNEGEGPTGVFGISLMLFSPSVSNGSILSSSTSAFPFTINIIVKLQ